MFFLNYIYIYIYIYISTSGRRINYKCIIATNSSMCDVCYHNLQTIQYGSLSILCLRIY